MYTDERDLPTPIADAVLAALRDTLGTERVAYRQPPRLFQDGGENTIAMLELDGGPRVPAGRLVLRCVPERRPGAGVRLEAAVHGALRDQGYPAPRVLAAVDRAGPWGSGFLLMERLPGRTPLHEVGELDRVFASAGSALRALPPLVWSAVHTVPRYLGDWMARLHALDAGAFVKAIEAAGFSPGDYTARGRLAALARRADAANLQGLAPALAWLDAHAREPRTQGLLHCDFQFLNLLVDDDGTVGVIDWSADHLTLGDPELDVGHTCALLALRLPGIPRGLRSTLARVQRRMERTFVQRYRACSRRALDAERVHWARVFRYTREMIAAGEFMRDGDRATTATIRHDEPPWLIPELREWVLGELSGWVGAPVTIGTTGP